MRNQNLDLAVMHTSSIHCRIHLFKIGDIGAKPQRIAARMLDLKMRQIEFSLAAGQQRYPITRRCEADCQPLADTSSGARHQNAGIGQSLHRLFSF